MSDAGDARRDGGSDVGDARRDGGSDVGDASDLAHPRLLTEATRERARAAWRERGTLRVEGVLREPVARAVLEDLRRLPYVVELSDDAARPLQAWRCAFAPEAACDHLLCRLGRWLRGEAVAWISDVAGQALAPARDGLVVAALLDKGCYVDPRRDEGGGRAVGYVLGLTPEAWPAAEGGHGELVDAATGEVVERRAPGWNTLDLLRAGARYQVPILREHREARAVVGWLHAT